VNDGRGGDRSNGTELLVLIFVPVKNGSQSKQLIIKNSTGASIKEISDDDLSAFRTSYYPVGFCNNGQDLFPPIHPAHFSYTTVLQRFRQLRSVSPTITVAEALITHPIFGSVGQIEKMESLSAARVHPEEPLSNIGDSLMKQLIMWIRDFDLY